MEKLMSKISKQKFRLLKVKGVLVALALSPVAAFAQTSSSVDGSAVVAVITGALTAVAAIGAAWVGFKYLKKVWNKL